MSAGLTGPEPAASQRELDQLRADMRRLDDGGTRGVAAVQVQLTDAIKDIVELKSEMNSRFNAHDLVHQRDASARTNGRRWAFGAAIGAGTALAAIIGMLLDIASHIH